MPPKKQRKQPVQAKPVEEKPADPESDNDNAFTDEHEGDSSETEDKKTEPESANEDNEIEGEGEASPPAKKDNKKSKPEVTKKTNEVEKTSTVKNNEAEKTVASHPLYTVMIMEAVGESGKNGISRAKLVQFMKSKYKLEDIRSSSLKKAFKNLEEKEKIVNKTGTGMSGSFTLTKKEKFIRAKEILKAAKVNSAAVAAKGKPNPKIQPKKQVQKSKDDLELLKKKKKVIAKKPPLPKGKENKAGNKTDASRKPKILQAKVKMLSKSNSTGNMRKTSNKDEPSTSKKGLANEKKSPVAKKTKRAK